MIRRLSLIINALVLVNWSGFTPTFNPVIQPLVYVSPMPGAQNISPGTSIAISASTLKRSGCSQTAQHGFPAARSFQS